MQSNLALRYAVILTLLFGCNAQFKELPETDAVISCREQGFQQGSLAFEDCVKGGVEAIKPTPGKSAP